jgi:hypothetical protein
MEDRKLAVPKDLTDVIRDGELRWRGLLASERASRPLSHPQYSSDPSPNIRGSRVRGRNVLGGSIDRSTTPDHAVKGVVRLTAIVGELRTARRHLKAGTKGALKAP